MNNRLIRKNILTMFPGCFAVSVVAQFIFVIDTILAGNFIGVDGVAAVTLGLPAYGIILSLLAIIVMGAELRLTWILGKGETEKFYLNVAKTFYSLLVISIIFSALVFFNAHSFIMAFGGSKCSETVVSYGTLYLKGCSMVILFSLLGGYIRVILGILGFQSEKLMASSLNVILNVIFSTCFMTVFPLHLKLLGLGLGTAIASFFDFVVGLISLKRHEKKVNFRIHFLSLRELGDTLRCGTSSSLDNICGCVSFAIVNRVILSSFGARGSVVLTIVSVVTNVFKIVKMPSVATVNTISPLLATLFASRDLSGFKTAIKESYGFGVLVQVAGALLCCVFADALIRIYGITDVSLMPEIRHGVRILVLLSVFVPVLFVTGKIYETSERFILSFMCMAVTDSLILPVFVILTVSRLGQNGIWLAYGLNPVIFLVLLYVAMCVKSRKILVPMEKFFCMKKQILVRVPALDFSIDSTDENISLAAEKVYGFFENSDVSKKTRYVSALSLDEICADFIQNVKASKKYNPAKKNTTDIKMFIDDDSVEIIVRNMSKPYNPLNFDHRVDDDFSKIGIMMIQKLAEKINYTYVYKMNIINIRIAKTTSDNKMQGGTDV